MNESSDPVSVPSGLEYLALERANTPVPRATYGVTWPPVMRDTPALSGAASRRLYKLAVQELQASTPTASYPDWSGSAVQPRVGAMSDIDDLGRLRIHYILCNYLRMRSCVLASQST